ncbi:hypothetical protein CC85DRAFT_299163 [Cutaneotrichosporon oleaginosum]|uniref:Uncharacterized protein n=1 Tax=Cutaneotrichosporon oleaginosum TaxID=879819 RepID=A0A0J0XY71_9TREE|nr:uncharacterized protein CC85DRAFT_299163 [Cutaneotrichosporon oleaginosum]KLT45990.1 hypothetical protein CC85DRAFT_299163 [Cutaneotrichosporon oleaginosum]TXT06684.1 hypothetical protein COLE_06015 [Cutaneotrichosporon oleaginosum]
MPAGSPALVRRDGNTRYSNGFYNKLFYILIAVLGAFALVSLLNYVRSRRRRLIVLREAERLGLMVPGMTGYVPMRERPALRKLDGWRTPDWWEVLEDAKASRAKRSPPRTPSSPIKEKGSVQHVEDLFYDANTSANLYDTSTSSASEQVRTQAGTLVPPEPPQQQQQQQQRKPTPQPQPPAPNAHAPDAEYGARGQLELGSIEDLRPLALIPVPVTVTEPAKPISPIPYFPNYVSYLKTAHDPKPPRFSPEDDSAFDSIIGEPLDVVVAVRMPRPPRTRVLDPDDDDAVMEEWGGLELGVASWQVVGSDR